MLPLAAAFPSVRFVGIDTKERSLALLRSRACAAGWEVGDSAHSTHSMAKSLGAHSVGGQSVAGQSIGEQLPGSRITSWHGTIGDYDGPCDVVLSLHACGSASDDALTLAARHGAAFAVSPCCIGKLRRGALSPWLRALLATHTHDGDAITSFSQIAMWADASASHAPLGDVDERRRVRSKRLVEIDRLAALPDVARRGQIMRLTGSAMGKSKQSDVLVGASTTSDTSG